MAGLIDSITDFIEGLFASDPQALRAKRLLREQAEVLQDVRPPVFNLKTDQILPGFAQSWSVVNALLAPLRDLFDKTLSHPDRKIQDLSLGFLVESVLTGELTDRRMALTFEAMKARLAQSAEPDRENATLTAEVGNLLSDLRRQDSDKVQKDFEGLYRLKALAGHSLVPLLTRFGHDVAGQGGQRYRAVDGASVLTDLLDLYFVVEGLDLGPGVEQLLGLLLERVGPQKAQENRKKTAVILDKMRDLSRGPCSPHLLLQLIRVLQRNPDAQPEVQRFGDRYVLAYSNTLSDRFTRDRDRALREQNESTLEADIAALFPGTPLLPLQFYNAETNQQFLDAGLPGLVGVKALQILRSFCFSVLKTGYLDSVKKVVVDGFFTDKEWGQKLSDSLYAASEILTRLEAFDHSLDSDAKMGLPALEKYISGKVPVSAVPKQIIDKINRNAMGLLEEETKVVSVLALRIQEVLTDYKSPRPEWVQNIKTLGGQNQRPFLESLVNGFNKTAQFLRIMKHFIVVK